MPEIILNAIIVFYWVWNHHATMPPQAALVVALFPPKLSHFIVRHWPNMSRVSSGRFYVTKNRSYGNHTTELKLLLTECADDDVEVGQKKIQPKKKRAKLNAAAISVEKMIERECDRLSLT